MAEATRKKPISRHPLFPATVALWFGALFGLGSMAIKPSLIEQAVLAVGLPAVVPSAEPPLGATMQLLLALSMAGLGGLLGALLARRLGRPKVEKKQRRRDPTVAQTSSDGANGYGWNAEEDAGSSAATRRRQLTMQEDTRPTEHHDPAPLPGQTSQVLDVSEFDLEGFESEEPDTIQEFVPELGDNTSDAGHEVIGQLASEEREIPADAHPFDNASVEADPEVADFGSETESETEPVREIELESPDRDAREMAADELEVESGSDFDSLQRSLANDAFDDEVTCPAAACSESFDRSEEPVTQTVADGGTEERAFDPVGDDRHADDGEAFRLEAAAFAADAEGDVEEDHSAAHPVHADSDEGAWEPVSGIAASRIMTASLDQLSHAELLERLALTLERSRSSSRPSNAGSDLAGEQPVFEAIEVEVKVNDAALDQEQPQVAAIGETAAEAAVSNVPDAPFLEQATQPPVPVIPAALRPIDFEEESEADQLPSVVPPRQFSMADETDSPADASEVNEVTEEAEAEGGNESRGPTGDDVSGEPMAAVADDLGQESETADVEQELEEGYSSLLNLSLSDRSKFVRIEEPEIDEGEVKPFVVFPGDNSAELAPFARPAVVSEPHTAAETRAVAPELPQSDERRFDQPDESIHSVSQANDVDPDLDPEETERSLKAALATLQRMSGAA